MAPKLQVLLGYINICILLIINYVIDHTIAQHKSYEYEYLYIDIR